MILKREAIIPKRDKEPCWIDDSGYCYSENCECTTRGDTLLGLFIFFSTIVALIVILIKIVNEA